MPRPSRPSFATALIRYGVLALTGAAVLILSPIATLPATAQEGSSLSGVWAFDAAASQLPREIGFSADFLPLGRGGDGRRGDRRGGDQGGTLQPTLRPQGESYDVAQRRQILTDEVRMPPSRLTVVETPETVIITDENGRSRTLHPDGRAESLQIGSASILTVARREAGALVVLYSVADLRQLRYSYVRPEGQSHLVVDVRFLERGVAGDTVHLVYSDANAKPAATTTATRESGGVTDAPAVPGAPPSMMPRAGSEFRGLTRLGVVVEEPGSQAASCGLTKDGLEAAATESFTGAGLKVSANSDEDTYVHISIMTSTLPTGMCISRFDWSIYSTTEATLSYQSTPLLAQVLLAHKGGMTGSLPATHGADVIRSLTEGFAQIVTVIRDANK